MIIALDADGTLCRPDGTVSPTNRHSIERAADNGHVIALVTGRAPHAAQSVLAHLPSGAWVICLNGAVVLTPAGAVARSWPIPPIVLRDVLNDMRRTFPHLPVAVDSAVGTSCDPTFLGRLRDLPPHDTGLDPLLATPLPAWPAAVSAPPVLRIRVRCPASGPEDDRIVRVEDIHRWARRYLAGWPLTGSRTAYLVAADASKGSALAFLADHLGIERENILTAGNDTNDVPMLLWAGMSLAVAGATAAARAAAACQAGDDDVDALAAAVTVVTACQDQAGGPETRTTDAGSAVGNGYAVSTGPTSGGGLQLRRRATGLPGSSLTRAFQAMAVPDPGVELAVALPQAVNRLSTEDRTRLLFGMPVLHDMATLLVAVAERMLPALRIRVAEDPHHRVAVLGRDATGLAVALHVLDPTFYRAHVRHLLLSRALMAGALDDAQTDDPAFVLPPARLRPRSPITPQPGSRRHLDRYLARHDVLRRSSGAGLTVVDIGTHGTIRAGLASLYPTTIIRGLYAVYLGLPEEPHPGATRGVLDDIQPAVAGPDLAMHQASATVGHIFRCTPAIRVLQAFAQADHDPIVGFNTDTGRLVQMTTSANSGDATTGYASALRRLSLHLIAILAEDRRRGPDDVHGTRSAADKVEIRIRGWLEGDPAQSTLTDLLTTLFVSRPPACVRTS